MMAVVNSINDRTIHGNRITSTAMTPSAFGTNARVCSWMVVTAWNKLTPKPMIIAVNKKGAAMIKAWNIMFFNNSMANSGVIPFLYSGLHAKTARQGTNDQFPSVHKDK